VSAPSFHFDIEQGTPEWHAIRAGKWSASRAGTIMGGLTTKGLEDLIMDMAWGRVYGPVEHSSFKSAAMERGNNLEPETRESYAFATDRVIDECGFVEHATIPNVGWSPDGLCGRKHAIEAKNPLHKAYMEVKRTGNIPSEYLWQTKWGMWVGELDSQDFLCDHPKAGLIIIPCQITDSEKDHMSSRVQLLEPRVAEWIDILNDKRKAA
jgi:putative phage-type endonuclease